MLLDALTTFAEAVALSTAATGIALPAGSQMDLGAAARDIGDGTSMDVVIQIQTAVTSGGSATVSFILASDSTAAIAVDGSATVHYQSAAIAVATLVAGYQIRFRLPYHNPPYERYLGILQNVGVAALTAGKINAFLIPTSSDLKLYTSAR